MKKEQNKKVIFIYKAFTPTAIFYFQCSCSDLFELLNNGIEYWNQYERVSDENGTIDI